MIENFLEGTLYYDFPSFEVALFSLLLAFVLSTTVALVFQYTFRGETFPNNFFQAMVLSAIVTSMIMMAVGNNLAVGFSIIGAVAIIRFRTVIQNPRNIIFMFAAISIGIATGVYGYAIAIAGTIIFCLIAILLSFSRYRRIHPEEYDVIVLHKTFDQAIEPHLQKFCSWAELRTQRTNQETNRSEFIVRMKDDQSSDALFRHLRGIEAFDEVRVEKRRPNYQL